MIQNKYSKIKITQVRSLIHRPEGQKRTIKALGLYRMHHTVTHEATPQILGMTNKVKHLVNVEEVK
jgi:large subunit ribosomal protein L30